MIVGSEKLHTEARDSLARIQTYAAEDLERYEDLGAQLNFGAAVEPAKRLVELFSRLSPAALDDFPDPVLTNIRDRANGVFNLFNEINNFDPSTGNPRDRQKELVKQLSNTYPSTFEALHPLIAYSLHRSADFGRLDAAARATLQGVQDQASAFSEKMTKHEIEAKRVLDAIRKVAAEEGVTQQAAHFRAESEEHSGQADIWLTRTTWIAVSLGLYAIASIFIHKIPGLEPGSVYDTVQLAISKVLVFFVIAYMLILSARNFMSHKHNAVVNKHRQNALMTHRALVEGTANSGVRDAVMVQAANCIFSPQPTGYSQSGGEGESSSPRSVVELASRSAVTAGSG